ncbi:hypothetical protein BP5796_02307 [Coleophoma crateriformis]|uniref:Uncharacterized protein n=1 Tax=Coleophoma crateriformis TaxID=565419 RepID=A0A3D8SXT8_9HELO|nr:hypothetical protein BP5796_02307 [Coleophoma crateriformis]
MAGTDDTISYGPGDRWPNLDVWGRPSLQLREDGEYQLLLMRFGDWFDGDEDKQSAAKHEIPLPHNRQETEIEEKEREEKWARSAIIAKKQVKDIQQGMHCRPRVLATFTAIGMQTTLPSTTNNIPRPTTSHDQNHPTTKTIPRTKTTHALSGRVRIFARIASSSSRHRASIMSSAPLPEPSALDDRTKLAVLSHVGIGLNADGDLRDGLGNPAGRRGPRDAEAPARHRVAFDPADDEVLREWVRNARLQGLTLKPKIFQDLESVEPRHTAQSWQARWKKLSKSDHLLTDPRTPEPSPPATSPNPSSTNTSSVDAPAPSPPEPSPSPCCLVLEDGPRYKQGSDPDSEPNRIPQHSGLTRHNAHGGREPDGSRAMPWQIPAAPTYPPLLSRVHPGQMRGIEWLTSNGKRRFEAQQTQLLSCWGVTPEHRATCVSVPRVWAEVVDPLASLPDLDERTYASFGDARLAFSLFDHSTAWVRAATWFASAPHTGLELDNFLCSGPFLPMEGSHLCHHPHCIVPEHATYESAATNDDRRRCYTLAQDLRALGLPVPEHCIRHKHRPCLMQLAALTPFEAYLIQFAIARRAKGLLGQDPLVLAPADHPFATFERRLPVSFAMDITVDAAYLTPISLREDPAEIRPVFYCNYCISVTPFKSLSGFWAHLRDGHPLAPQEGRLADIVDAARKWESYKGSAAGGTIDAEDVTWKQVQQTKEADFGWDVVLGWKLAYNRKRKYGRLAEDYHDTVRQDSQPP